MEWYGIHRANPSGPAYLDNAPRGLIGNQIIHCDMPSGKQEKLECCAQTAKPRIPMARSFALIAVNALVSTA